MFVGRRRRPATLEHCRTASRGIHPEHPPRIVPLKLTSAGPCGTAPAGRHVHAGCVAADSSRRIPRCLCILHLRAPGCTRLRLGCVSPVLTRARHAGPTVGPVDSRGRCALCSLPAPTHPTTPPHAFPSRRPAPRLRARETCWLGAARRLTAGRARFACRIAAFRHPLTPAPSASPQAHRLRAQAERQPVQPRRDRGLAAWRAAAVWRAGPNRLPPPQSHSC